MTTPKKNPETNREKKLTRSNTRKTWGKKLKNVKGACIFALGTTLLLPSCGTKESDVTKTSKEYDKAMEKIEKEQKEVTEAENKVKNLEEDLIEAQKQVIEEKKDVIEAQKEAEKVKKEVQDESKKL